MCHSHPLLPTGLADGPNLKPVKLYCARCEDMYNPKSSRHAQIDGAYFGTSFHNILFQVYPALVPTKSCERFVPRCYGFKVHSAAALVRWQNGQRNDMRRGLRTMDIDTGFKEDDGEEEIVDEEEDEEDDDEEDGVEGIMLEDGRGGTLLEQHAPGGLPRLTQSGAHDRDEPVDEDEALLSGPSGERLATQGI